MFYLWFVLVFIGKVVQYILDLNDNRFSDGVIRQFAGNVCALSVQKFSSNVIEKVSPNLTIYTKIQSTNIQQ